MSCQVMHSPRRLQRAVALIEALVALAVMAIGLLGVVGMQATLRTNAELSRQRSEAVRMAQEKIESLRAFSQLGVEGAGTSEPEYADVIASSAEDVTPTSGRASATFKRTVAVVTPGTGDPAMKTLTVTVEWWDRRADASNATDANRQRVVLNTAIARVDPALGTALGLPTNRSVTQRPRGRNIAIPTQAVDTSSGTSSRFNPPGSSGVTWVFNNDTARITISGSRGQGVLLSGYVRFATGSVQPTGIESEMPPGSPVTFGMQVNLTSPVISSADIQPACYVGSIDPSGAAPYYCVVPITTTATGQASTFSWSGRSVLNSLNLASSASDPSGSHYRVCRYTPDPTTDTPTAGNVAHPLNYTGVASALTNQNFLIIRAGDNSTTAFTCPTDDSSTPLVDGDTRIHQP